MSPLPLGIIASAGGVNVSYELIQTQLISSNVSSVTFSSIPSTFTHLELRYVYIAGASGGGNNISFNGDSGANYSNHGFVGNANSATQFSSANTTSINIAGYNAGGNTVAPLINIVSISDYSSSSKTKAIRSLWGIANSTGSNSETGIYSGVWRSTSPITSFTVTSGGGNWANTSRLSLYGIKA